MTEPAPTEYYGGLTHDSVRDVLPPNTRGASDTLLEDYLQEAIADVENSVDTLPEDDKLVRGVVRDIAASRALIKLIGTADDAGRRGAIALRDDAWDRLDRWIEGSLPAGYSGENRYHNFLSERIWNLPGQPAQGAQERTV